ACSRPCKCECLHTRGLSCATNSHFDINKHIRSKIPGAIHLIRQLLSRLPQYALDSLTSERGISPYHTKERSQFTNAVASARFARSNACFSVSSFGDSNASRSCLGINDQTDNKPEPST